LLVPEDRALTAHADSSGVRFPLPWWARLLTAFLLGGLVVYFVLPRHKEIPDPVHLSSPLLLHPQTPLTDWAGLCPEDPDGMKVEITSTGLSEVDGGTLVVSKLDLRVTCPGRPSRTIAVDLGR